MSSRPGRRLLMGTAVLGDWGMPSLSDGTWSAVRFLYGCLLAAHLLLALPHARRFFLSERWGGYAASSRRVELLQNPIVMPLVLVGWLACAVLIAFDVATVWLALASLLLGRELFIAMRWRGALRGMGAPGFMTYWLGVTVFLQALTRQYAPDQASLALLVSQVDFALIFLSAGIYKLISGYRHNYGVDLGMANPQWGYFWRQILRVDPNSRLLWALNQLGWASEIVAAALMLIPSTRALGGALLILIFVLIRTQIRLGVLCEMVMLVGVLYFAPGSAGDDAVGWLFSWVPQSDATDGGATTLGHVLQPIMWGYLGILPLAHIGLYANLVGRRHLPGALQRLLDRYTNFFGIIIWRVFTADVINFFVEIERRPAGGGPAVPISTWGWTKGLRYGHVAEAITVTSLFTTLRYHPSNNALFVERLLRYARTLHCPADEKLVFRVVSVVKGERFRHVPAAEFVVDVRHGTVEEHVLDRTYPLRRSHDHSPVIEGLRPGSYAPRLAADPDRPAR